MDRSAEAHADYSAQMRHLQQLPACGLVTTGRTGSDYLQSLLDSHPEVLTFNGNLSFYKDWRNSVCRTARIVDIGDCVDEFIGRHIDRLKSKYDVLERKHQLGPSDDQCVDIDTQAFRAHAIGLLGQSDTSSRAVLLAIYGAYNLCLGHPLLEKRVLFHHAHHSDELDCFLGDFPQASILVTTRDPRATFVSGIENWRDFSLERDSEEHLYGYIKRILEDSTPYASRGRPYAAVRLEDLPGPRVVEELRRWLGIRADPCLTVSTWAGLEWHGDALSKRRYKSSGWNPVQTHNAWAHRLGRMDKYVLNYIMRDRLSHYGYPVDGGRWWDGVVVLFLLVLPLKYERRFLTPTYIASKIRSGRKSDWGQLVSGPVYYLLRVRLFFSYWGQTVRGAPFNGPWLGGDR